MKLPDENCQNRKIIDNRLMAWSHLYRQAMESESRNNTHLYKANEPRDYVTLPTMLNDVGYLEEWQNFLSWKQAVGTNINHLKWLKLFQL